MNRRRFLILGHGTQERLVGIDRPKQFLPLADEETIIERTVRLATAYGEVFVWAPLVEPWTTLVATIWDASTPSTSIVQSLRTSYPLWREGAIILLGDVVFSKSLIERISIAGGGYPLFFGRDGANTWTGKEWGEIYALKVGYAETAENFYRQLPETGKLWDVLEALCPRSNRSMYFREVTDFTDDIDTPEDIEQRLPILRKLVEEEKSHAR